MALLAQVISNMSGRTLKDEYLKSIKDFLPDYLDERNPPAPQSEAQQIAAEKAFVKKALETGVGAMNAT